MATRPLPEPAELAERALFEVKRVIVRQDRMNERVTVCLLAAPTASVASHLRRCLSAMVAAGLEEGLLLASQDVLRGVHWRAPEDGGLDAEEEGRFVDEADIPTAGAVHALAGAAGERGSWWRELQVLAVAYSGLRWGEMAARPRPRTAAGAPPCTRPAPPAGRSWPACWPAAWPSCPLTASCSPRPPASGPGAPTTGATSSTPRRRPPAGPAAPAAAGRGRSTPSETCSPPGPCPGPGPHRGRVPPPRHSTVRVTQDLYISADGDLYERFFTATEQ